MTLLSLVATAALWVGLLLAVWIDNITAALLIIALYRLPEALILWWMANKRGWLILWREGQILAFFALGIALGWTLLMTWEALT